MTITFSLETGIVISNTIPPLHIDSWVEAPVVIQVNLTTDNIIQVGAFTGIYGNGRLGHCRIGRYCSIASGIDIASDQHPLNWLSTSMVQYVPNIHGWGDWLTQNGQHYISPRQQFISNAPVTIGNDVWIGTGVFIKSGVTIGNGAIIAAHSVVINDVPPYAIVAGVPATIKKYRFDEIIIDKLQTLCWWHYNIQAIADRVDFKNINSAIASIENEIALGYLAPYYAPIHRLNEPQ